MFGSKIKKPLYTVVVSEKETPHMNTMKSNIPPPPAQRVNIISVQPMSIEKLIGGYKNEEEEEMLPGFRYLKKMKNDIKKERIKSVLRKH